MLFTVLHRIHSFRSFSSVMSMKKSSHSQSLRSLTMSVSHADNIKQIEHLNKILPQSNPSNQRTSQLYLPIFNYIKQMHQKHSLVSSQPLLVGISAPQGCGKTTLTNIISDLFKLDNQKCLAISIDDFYLTAKEQTTLAELHPQNELLKYRGNGEYNYLSISM